MIAMATVHIVHDCDSNRSYRGLTGGFLLLRNFSVTISVRPHVCVILVYILISMFLR